MLSVEEGRGGVSGIFEIVAADNGRGGRVIRRPICAGNVDCHLYHPFATLGHPIFHRHPYLPKGARGAGIVVTFVSVKARICLLAGRRQDDAEPPIWARLM